MTNNKKLLALSMLAGVTAGCGSIPQEPEPEASEISSRAHQERMKGSGESWRGHSQRIVARLVTVLPAAQRSADCIGYTILELSQRLRRPRILFSPPLSW